MEQFFSHAYIISFFPFLIFFWDRVFNRFQPNLKLVSQVIKVWALNFQQIELQIEIFHDGFRGAKMKYIQYRLPSGQIIWNT